jgi:hypothetical protein
MNLSGSGTDVDTSFTDPSVASDPESADEEGNVTPEELVAVGGRDELASALAPRPEEAAPERR